MKILIYLILFLNTITNNDNPNQIIPELNHNLALVLRAEGLYRYSTFIDGGSKCDNVERNTPANQEGYYYYCSDLDTYEEMYRYLEESFTHEIAKKLIENRTVVTNNRLAYQSVGWGSINDWSRATGEIVSKNNSIIKYRFNVPVFGDSAPADEIVIEYQNVTKKGWRINSPAGILR